jgi:hypothetical protein
MGGGGIYFLTDTPSFSALVRQPFTIFLEKIFFPVSVCVCVVSIQVTLLFVEQIARAVVSLSTAHTHSV